MACSCASLHNIAIGTRDLVTLFSNGLPVLRKLALSIMMLLLDGRWEWDNRILMDMGNRTALRDPGAGFYVGFGLTLYKFAYEEKDY